MALNTPRTWVSGETVTATHMNDEIRDATTTRDALYTPLSSKRTSDFTTVGGTESGALFTLSVPSTGAGYEVILYVPATYSTVSGDRAVYYIKLNGTTIGAGYANCSGAAGAAITVWADIAAGSTGTVTATVQRIGGTGNVTARFADGGYMKLRQNGF